jgi:hypothetical protein
MKGRKGQDALYPLAAIFRRTQRFLDHNSDLECRRHDRRHRGNRLDRSLSSASIASSGWSSSVPASPRGGTDNEMSAATAGPSGRIDKCVCSQSSPEKRGLRRPQSGCRMDKWSRRAVIVSGMSRYARADFQWKCHPILQIGSLLPRNRPII